MTMEINNTDPFEKMPLPDDSGLSGSGAFDDSKLAKLNGVISQGLNPYPYKFEKDEDICEILEKFEDFEKNEGLTVRTAGRLYNIRKHGKMIFADLGDQAGRVQVLVRKGNLPDEEFEIFKNLVDSGDIIGVQGDLFRTKRGENSISVSEFSLLSKSLCALPEKFHGLKDVETRYRKRYLDLIVNAEKREIFVMRSKLISEIRRFLTDREFLEFETPILQTVYGGANARPFTTFHNCLGQNLFLRIAPELYLKRLVVGGYEKVFEICKNFRNEDIDTTHNPEFTMIEVYEAYRDYNDMMDLTESLVSELVFKLTGSYEVQMGEKTINLRSPWKRISMEDALKEYAGLDIFAHSIEDLKKIAIENRIEDYEKAKSHGEFLALLFEGLVEDKLIDPTFIYDFPVENSPLAKNHREKAGFVERFELFLNGWELANGYSELNDPLEQEKRFEEQDKKRKLGDLEAQTVDYDFINALGYGLPPTGGMGLGIDRLTMILSGLESIKEVILFPQMKRED
ncbi:lysine--tRNA ligase [Methanosarcina mazei]|uniref:Lysine--tRNA ligase 2 n=7 Tax=Methanosarcina mazei TaxID=2209 RepID=SYK2_METMA|nr:lysine--tRNA ligase [Methanosarcina mazei]Q8PVP6.1 RecName: Full=Lysine--tRNA ligase 2; AltName: Full=Lysyl-tRNA synthetase 2; Short=LysRS 2 [Methanosarcina mazei Go1]AAM31612.1 Lysyl-tRNA synthetase [Methanosarcina mazei Go1]AKB65964.1 Lysyl-tRNA synthetase (class II) [Methanosarcina mazei S-6]AKB71549.1 Lysyl-tRNA synthetase (class II) [Methanosarcina mazei C16]KKG02536.1 lysyl-tRNA synthetase [Methanosarcina mazei]KKG04388.1 lysyl-tRNA synthetase [Methanosarcina mazei]